MNFLSFLRAFDFLHKGTEVVSMLISVSILQGEIGYPDEP